MAITQGMANSFKVQLLSGTQNFNSDTFKLALYTSSAVLGEGSTAYTASGECPSTGNYTAGGNTVTNGTSPSSTNASATAGVGYWTPSANLSWANLTQSTAFDTVLLYNNTNSNRAVSVHTFGSQTITAGTFTLTMPSNAAGTALLNIA